MDELRRLNYLEALGIQQWVAKAPVEFAKPTEYFVPESEVPSPLSPVIAEPIDTASQTAEEETDEEKVSSNDVQAQSAEKVTVAQATQGESAESKTSDMDTSMASELFVELHGVRNAYLFVIQKDSVEMLPDDERILLGNILKSSQFLMGDESNKAIQEAFRWPLFDSQSNVEHLANSEQAKQDAFNAFLNAQLKRHSVKTLVMMGEDLASVIDEGSLFNAKAINSIYTTTLSQLKQQQNLKSVLWQQLKNAM